MIANLRNIAASVYGRIAIRFRIAAALTCLMIGTVLIAGAAGFVPNRQSATLEGRRQLLESLAITTTTLADAKQYDALETILTGIAGRNDDVLSIGLTNTAGVLGMAIGRHADLFIADTPNHINQMQTPIYGGQDPIGHLQIRFADTGGWMGLNNLGSAWLLIAIVPACFVQFSFFLRKTLEQLDPSGAMPVEVEETLNTFSVGMFLLNSEGRVLFANQRIAETFGCDRSALIGGKADDLEWIDDESELPWRLAEQAGRPVYDRILQIVAAGRKLTFSVNCTPISGQGFFVSFDDITLLEENKAALAVARDQAENANEAKSQFLANMSHEIRTPLGAVLGFTDVLRRGLVTDSTEAVGHLNMIHRSGSHLLELINDILDLSKIEAGHLQIETIQTEIDKIIGEVADTMRVRADEKSIDLRIDFQSDLPRTIQSDPTRLRQIITNLVGNAIKFTDNGSVTIAVRLRPASAASDESPSDGSADPLPTGPSPTGLLPADLLPTDLLPADLLPTDLLPTGPAIVIDVIDTGVGMTAEQQGRIFEKFVQADSSTTRKFGGTGLGLSISRQLAQAMGGTLSVSGDVGVGSTFTLAIAVAEMSTADLITPAEIAQRAKQQAQIDGGGLMALPADQPILVVDDGEGNRRLIDLVLRRAGATVRCVTNGAEAIAAIQAGGSMRDCPFSIILMDMQMPVMDGYEATAAIRDGGGTVPIIALTGNAMKGDRRRCTDAGCDDFMTKPIQIDALLRLVASYLQPESNAIDRPVPPVVTDPNPGLRPGVNDDPIITPTLPMDDEDFRSITQDFVRRLGDRIDQMQSLVQQAAFDDLADQAHWLKGAGGTVGLEVLTDPAKRLEQTAKDGDGDTATRLLAEIRSIQQRVRCEVPPVEDVPDDSRSFDDEEPIRSSLPLDEPEMIAIVDDFLDRLDQRLDRLQSATASGDRNVIEEIAQWLLGSAGTVGFAELTDPADRMIAAVDREDRPAVLEIGRQIDRLRDRIVRPDGRPLRDAQGISA